MTPRKRGFVAVVEDDPSMRAAFRRLFVQHKYRVQTFASAEELLCSPELDQVVCVVTDIDLGDGMSGLDLGDTIRAGGDKTPLIFITGSPNAAVRRRASALHCVALLEKPFAGQELFEAVSKVVVPEP